MNAPTIPPALPPARTFIKWGDYMICSQCRMAKEWCGCAKNPPPPPDQGDGDVSSLNARAKAWKGTP